MVLDILKDLLTDFEVVHQTGGSEVYKDFETLRALAEQLPKLRTRYTIGKWFDTEETVNIFSKATIVVDEPVPTRLWRQWLGNSGSLYPASNCCQQ